MPQGSQRFNPIALLLALIDWAILTPMRKLRPAPPVVPEEPTLLAKIEELLVNTRSERLIKSAQIEIVKVALNHATAEEAMLKKKIERLGEELQAEANATARQKQIMEMAEDTQPGVTNVNVIPFDAANGGWGK